jgi:hypothetical protein
MERLDARHPIAHERRRSHVVGSDIRVAPQMRDLQQCPFSRADFRAYDARNRHDGQFGSNVAAKAASLSDSLASQRSHLVRCDPMARDVRRIRA